MKGKLIGQGRTAEVYEWGDNEIIKLYRKDLPDNFIEEEFKISTMVQNSGVPIPKIGGMIDCDNRKGIIYEKIIGQSMLVKISKKPWTIGSEGKRLAELHYNMHKCTNKNLPRYKAKLERNIRLTELLSEEKKKIILDYLYKLPDDNKLCHSDFHPDNIILSNDKPVIIDWMTAASGNPAADVARTKIIITTGALPPETPTIVKFMVAILRSKLYSDYINRYLKISDVTMKQIREWELPIAAARLLENLQPIEKTQIMALIEKRLLKLQ